MATIDLGRLGFVNKGTYNNSTTYEKNDLVQFTDGGILSTYLYIDSTAQSGQAPSSSGTVGSRWVYFAKGVADAVAGAGNNKVLVTDGSGNLSPLSIGSAGQAIKVNSSANGYEFGTAGGILQVIQDVKTDYTVTNSAGFIPNLDVTITPSSTSSKILIDTRLSLTGQHGDGMGCKLQRSIGGGSYTSIGQADTAGSRQRSSFSGSAYTGDGSGTDTVNIPVNGIFLDSPNTTSAITYKVRFEIAGSNYAGINMCTSSSGTIQGDSADALVMVSSMTCYEITV